MQSLFNKFKNAIRGMLLLLVDHSVLIQCGITIVVIAFFSFFDLEVWEWIAIILCCAIVIVLEMVNTVIERTLDFIEPNKDKRIGDLKDMSAGVVLIASLFACVVGIIILGGKLL